MLRQLRLKNFVKFKDEQTIDIKEKDSDLLVIIGPSGSGKSCLLEAIRRCTESVNNESISSMPDENDDSIVVCTFENISKNKGIKFVSIYLSYYTEEKQRCTIKCMVESGSTEAYFLIRKGSKKWLEYKITIDCQNVLLDKSKCLKEKAEKIRSIYEKIVSSDLKGNETVDPKSDLFDAEFRKLTEIEFIFAVRPLGPTQSSFQLREERKPAEKRYSETTENAYIIRKFLEEDNWPNNDRKGSVNDTKDEPKEDKDHPKNGTGCLQSDKNSPQNYQDGQRVNNEGSKEGENCRQNDNDSPPKDKDALQLGNNASKNGKDIQQKDKDVLKTKVSQYNTEIEKKIFDCIVGSDKYTFFTEKDNIVVKTVSTFSLLKAPEGAVEAKYLSVLLSKTKINILCLDEPCRGMNYEMVNRLTHFVLSNKSLTGQKQIIIVTSNPNFLTPQLRDKAMICVRKSTETSILKRINDTKLNLTDEIFTAITFFSRVLFVEGPSDLYFIETMRHILLGDDKLLRQYKDNDGSQQCERKYENLDYFLINLKVMPLNGCPNVKKIERSFKELEFGPDRQSLILLDNDALPRVKKNGNPRDADLHERGIFVWDNTPSEELKILIPSYNEFGYFHGNGRCIGMMRSKPFTNNPGTMEDVVLSSSIQHDSKYHPNKGKDCGARDCEGLLEILKNPEEQLNIHIVKSQPWESCGCRKNQSGPNDEKLGDEITSMTEKFLLNHDLSIDKIEKIVGQLLKVAIHYKEGEIWRFLNFLREKSIKEETD